MLAKALFLFGNAERLTAKVVYCAMPYIPIVKSRGFTA